MLAVGLLLPWCIGIGIKLFLDSQGEPTWNWSYLLHPGIVLAELWASLWFAAPSLVLAYFAYRLFTGRVRWLHRLNRVEHCLIIVAAMTWGTAGSVPVFYQLFWKFDPIVLFVPFFVTAVYVDDYAFGLLAGLLFAWLSWAIRTRLGSVR